MNYYETVYIIHPALQEGRLHDIVNKFHSKLEGLKGKVLYVNNWGKKKLAYPIDKQKYGTYILCQYSLDNQNIKNLSQELELNPNILRYLITVIDESKILEGPTKLDSDTLNGDKQKIESSEDTTEKSTKDSDTLNEDKQKIESSEDAKNSKASSEEDPEPKDSNDEDPQPEDSNEEDTKIIDSEEDDKKSSSGSEEK